MLKLDDLRKKSLKALQKQATELKTSVVDFQRDRYQNDDRNVRKKKQMKKDLARVLTVINEKQNEESKGEEK